MLDKHIQGEPDLIPYIDYSLCTGCEACAEMFPSLFVMRDGVAWVVQADDLDPEEHDRIIRSCAFGAISVE